MANNKFPKLNYPRVNPKTFEPLIGVSLPPANPHDTGSHGKFIDNLIKKELQILDPGNGNPDIADYGIEVKSKSIDSDTNWTIATMTARDIIHTDYIKSPVYNKIQALLIIFHNGKEIVGVDLEYFDNDDIQTRLNAAYEEMRRDLIAHTNQHGYVFSPSQQFKSEYAVFEHTNISDYFKFRVRPKHLKTLRTVTGNVAVFDSLFESY